MKTIITLVRVVALFLAWTGLTLFIGSPMAEWPSNWRFIDGPGRVIFIYLPAVILAQWFLQGTKLSDVLQFILPRGRNRKPGLPARKAGRKFAKPPVVETASNPLHDAPRELSDDLREYLNEGYNQPDPKP